jgi:hypothetical protein
MVNTTRRKYQRFQAKIPILVNGVDTAGCAFRLAAETLNGSIDGWAYFLLKSQVLPPLCWFPLLKTNI